MTRVFFIAILAAMSDGGVNNCIRTRDVNDMPCWSYQRDEVCYHDKAVCGEAHGIPNPQPMCFGPPFPPGTESDVVWICDGGIYPVRQRASAEWRRYCR